MRRNSHLILPLIFFPFAFEFEGGNSPSSAASVRPSSGSTALSGYVQTAPSYEFSF